MKNFKQFNEELFIRKKYQDQKPGQHNILFLMGSWSELDDDLSFYIPKRNQRSLNRLAQFGDNVEFPTLYWRGGDKLFDEVDDIINEKSIDVIVGNSAGGFLSFYFSNKYKIPALSINPAFAPTSEAPTLQSLPEDMKNASICGKQVIIIGKKDSKRAGGVDGKLVIKHLKNIGFENAGGEIIVIPGIGHRLESEQLDNVFTHFYKKCVK